MRGAIPPLPQYVFMAWCLVKHRDNFTFYFIISKQYSNNVAIVLSSLQRRECYCEEMRFIKFMFGSLMCTLPHATIANEFTVNKIIDQPEPSYLIYISFNVLMRPKQFIYSPNFIARRIRTRRRCIKEGQKICLHGIQLKVIN
jgi:hypothetical protein